MDERFCVRPLRCEPMKISALIAELQEAQRDLGDVEVYTVRSDMGDYDPELTLVDHCDPPHLYIG